MRFGLNPIVPTATSLNPHGLRGHVWEGGDARRRIVALWIVFLGLAVPASALTPPLPECSDADGTMHSYWFLDADAAIATSMAWNGDDGGQMLLFCDQNQAILLRPEADHDAHRNLIDLTEAAVDARRRYTVRQLAKEAGSAGIPVQLGKITQDNCVCAEFRTRDASGAN